MVIGNNTWDVEDCSMMWMRFEVERMDCEIWSFTIVLAEDEFSTRPPLPTPMPVAILFGYNICIQAKQSNDGFLFPFKTYN